MLLLGVSRNFDLQQRTCHAVTARERESGLTIVGRGSPPSTGGLCSISARPPLAARVWSAFVSVDPALRAAAARALALDDAALLAECVEQFFNAGGPGGQHQNKAETAVRLSHPATGVSVTATERRSQLMNRQEALERLRARLAALTVVQAPRVATRVSRSQKRRRVENKRLHSQKKKDRRGDGW